MTKETLEIGISNLQNKGLGRYIFFDKGQDIDRLCGVVVRVLSYRSGCPGSNPGTKKNVVGLERGPLSLVSTTEELLDRKIADPVWKT
jgi:hypothetical protein